MCPHNIFCYYEYENPKGGMPLTSNPLTQKYWQTPKARVWMVSDSAPWISGRARPRMGKSGNCRR